MKSLLFSLCVSRVVNAQQYTVVSVAASDVPSSQTVELSCEFTNQWTVERHPLVYPSANTHRSPPIMASHSFDYTMWADGSLASEAMQIVAETGVKLTLLEELSNSTEVLDEQSGRAMFNIQQESQVLPALMVDADYPRVSTVTKISPSPDWFTGFADYSILDFETNTWLASMEIDTYPFDAGTDSGKFYRSESTPTDPQENITCILAGGETTQARGLPEDGVFIDPDGTEVLPVGKWTCSIAAATSPSTAPDSRTASPTTSANVSKTVAPVSTTPTIPPTTGPSAIPTGAPTVPPTDVATNQPTGRPTSLVIPYIITSSVKGSVPSSDAIGVSCMIMNEWTSSRHPKDYPSDKASWSPMVVASHSKDFQMWENRQLASAGVRSLAMSNKPDLMAGELMIADEGVLDYREGADMKVSVRQNETIKAVRVNADYPYISTIASIVPSPDWFSGYYDFNFLDAETDTWYDKIVIETYPWDAGTDSGTTYESEPAMLLPSYLITQLTVGTVPDSGVFLDPDGSNVLPVSRWTCTRVEAPPPRQTSRGFVASVNVVTGGLMLLGATISLLQ